MSTETDKDPFNAPDFHLSDECVETAINKIENHRPINCIEIAHLAAAAKRYLEEKKVSAPKWKPIKTAPKDWSDIIVYVPESGKNEDVMQAHYSCEDGGYDDWFAFDGEAISPTHWLPLPEPPSHLPPANGGA